MRRAATTREVFENAGGGECHGKIVKKVPAQYRTRQAVLYAGSVRVLEIR